MMMVSDEPIHPFLDVPYGEQQDDGNRRNHEQDPYGAEAGVAKTSVIVPHAAVMRRIALFIDGMARAMILPFGPDLVHRLVYKSSTIAATTLPGVSYYLGWVVSVYIIGRWLGSLIALKWPVSHDHLPRHVARLGGIAVSLHVFTYGAGLGSVKILAAIRFLSAILTGRLCGITNAISLPEDEWVFRSIGGGKATLEEERMDAQRRREGYVDIASGTAKIYLTGFAVSILSGGLLFRQATKDSTFQALTGAYQYSWSPLFLVVVAVTSEVVLRGVFAAAQGKSSQKDIGTAKGRFTQGVARGRNVSGKSLLRDGWETADSLQSATKETSSLARPLIEVDFDDERSQLSNPASIDSERLVLIDMESIIQGGRTRRESDTSVDEFFDCHSVLTDEEARFDEPDSIIPLSSSPSDTREVCSYVGKRCVYNSGSPAYVTPGECVALVPDHYLKFYNNNEARARKAWEKTQEWRREKSIWRIHELPNHLFVKVKEAYPHYVHGHTKHGYPVVYEKPGKMRVKEMFREGVEINDMLMQLTFTLEYLSNRLSPSEEIMYSLNRTEKPTAATWGMMVVMDLNGLGISQISGDVLSYLKDASALNSDHYPLAMKRAFLINSPFWLAGAWSGVKSILPASVHVDILSGKNYRSALLDYIDEDQIPPEYGGTSPYRLASHPYEIARQQLAKESMENCQGDILQPEESMITPTKRVSVAPCADLSKYTPSQTASKRRYANSHDRMHRAKSLDVPTVPRKSSGCSGYRDTFLLVSLIHFFWSTVQGAIEVAIPLWIVSPAKMGGLGYSPSRSGVSLFTACLVLLALLRSRSSRLLSNIPSKSPLSALRIGAGSEAVLLLLLALVSRYSTPEKRSDSVTVMTSTMLLVACMALATMIGRSASKILHRVAAESFVRQIKPVKGVLTQKFLSHCACGRITASLNLVAEIVGVFLVTPLWTASIAEEQQAPFNAVLVLVVCGAISFVLYGATFALYLNAAGEFAPHPKVCCYDSKRRWCLQLALEAIAVSSSDIASLFEESNWSATPLLVGRDRSRTYSDASAVLFLEMMERGEDQADPGGRKLL